MLHIAQISLQNSFLRLPSLSFFLVGKEQDSAEDLNHLV